MEYNKIISVTGLGGLFELIGSKADGAIVRSLEDKTTKFASSRSHHFSHLESIEVYTTRENVNLIEVFRAMQAAGRPIPDYKDIAAVKAYFAEVYPEMDFDRVYTSDLKKMIRWYNILVANQINLESDREDNSEAAHADATKPVAPSKKPAQTDGGKTTKTKKTAEKKPKAAAADTTSGDQPPAKAKKKAAPKKKATKKED